MNGFPLSVSLVFAAVSVLAVAGVAGTFYFAYLRRKTLEGLAVSRGMNFVKEGPPQSLVMGTGLALFARGNRRHWANMLAGAGAGGAAEISFFDYTYSTGSGRNRHSRSMTVALADFRSPRLPDFELKPEGLIYKIGELLGFKDIDIESAPEFSSKYRLTGPSEPEVRAYFGPAAVMCFERHQGLFVQGKGRYLAIYRKEAQLSAAAYPGFIDEVKEVLAELGR